MGSNPVKVACIFQVFTRDNCLNCSNKNEDHFELYE